MVERSVTTTFRRKARSIFQVDSPVVALMVLEKSYLNTSSSCNLNNLNFLIKYLYFNEIDYIFEIGQLIIVLYTKCNYYDVELLNTH
jgi:hypothetical protein